MITRFRKTKLQEPPPPPQKKLKPNTKLRKPPLPSPEKKLKTTTKKNPKGETKKKRNEEPPTTSNLSFPEEDVINILLGFSTSHKEPASSKRNPAIEQEELLRRECSSKRKREIAQGKRTETGERYRNKRLKKGKRTKAYKNIIDRDEVSCPPSPPIQKAQEGLVAASAEEEPESATVNYREHNDQGCGQSLHTTVMEPSSGKRRKGRGITSLSCLTEDNGGLRQRIEYNTKGQPVGLVAQKFSTYLGVLARRMVPIIHETWPKVPKELKETLLKNVEAKYEINPKKRKEVLSAIGERWKKFKANLTKFFIRPFKDQPELLTSPPEQYKFIEQEHWGAFVRSRFSEEFERNSKCQAERQAKNIYNHRVGRKGYTGLVEELKQSLGASADKIDRSDLWKKARQDKNGVYLNDAIREKAELIDQLKKQKEDGKLTIEGDRDILTMALGTPEHSYRVRGVGSSVTMKTYFHRTRRTSKNQVGELQEKANQQADKFREMNQTERELQATPGRKHLITQSIESNSQVEGGYFNDDHPLTSGHETDFQPSDNLDARFDMPSPDFKSTNTTGTCCRLALGTKTNIVARGMVYEVVKPNEKIHNASLGENNVRVKVEYAISPNALLPVPVIGEMTMVKDAIGSFVAWPKEFVLTGVEEEENQDTAEESGPIQAFASFLDQMVHTNNIVIPIQSAIFKAEFEASLEIAGLMHLCNMQEIRASCIVTYIRFLYEKSSGSQQSYGFVNPVSFSSARGPDASSMVTKRLQTAERDQLVFVPCKTRGHWVLIIIDSSSMNVYWLDPLQKPPSMDIKIYVTTGLRTLQVNDKRRPNPTWHCIKCPKPPLDVQSGYHVMRYMRELMEEWTQPLTEKMLQLSQKFTYSREEIDEVRLELVDFILTTM